MPVGQVTSVEHIIAHHANSDEIGAHITVTADGSTISGWATTASNSFVIDRSGVAAMLAVLATKKANPSLSVGINFTGFAGDRFQGISDIRV